MSRKKWLFLLLYLLVSCVAILIIMALVTYVAVRFFYFIGYGTPFELFYIDILKYIEAAFYGGVVVGVGCWWIYYRHYNSRQ
ncbi:hypothetical protein FHU10_3745 [Serratia fonticola]|uniref:Uncharacterized protein n=1 Tax=Serratia fonticola TaxID=47917 RepID=A0A559T935_SERFO|nr:hypothetical protein [Serratia fonticola]TQI81340.1 hypothetical protein FHU09_3961 [Serratia fonticola]TQI96636.1 hypothetical protein FHU11_2084 [Serratia fonticola]TVZ71132.1 hypothetical protein FHU10_3745 [Serratia fonticola]